jgi:hypothetical protein
MSDVGIRGQNDLKRKGTLWSLHQQILQRVLVLGREQRLSVLALALRIPMAPLAQYDALDDESEARRTNLENELVAVGLHHEISLRSHARHVDLDHIGMRCLVHV